MTTLAVLPHWQEIPADNFVAEFPGTNLVGINLNQYSPTELKNCIIPWDYGASGEAAWAGKLGQSIYAKGRDVLWSVPFPGALRMEEVNEGRHDDLYIAIANELVRIAPKGKPIYVRPPWEFNLDGNIENRMLDKTGKPAPLLGKLAWRRIAALFRAISARFILIWSPAVERQNIVDPEAVWPGQAFVDIIAPDLYLCRAFMHTPGVYTGGWFREPLLKLRAWAHLKGKPFGISELGCDSEDMGPDLRMALADILAAPTGCHFVQWWNDWQMTDCRITEGRLPSINNIVKTAFGYVTK